MIDKVVCFLSEAFRKEGLLVPFGTTYRIAENLIAEQNKYSEELVCCEECKWFDANGDYCKFWQGVRHPEHYCGEGERKDND